MSNDPPLDDAGIAVDQMLEVCSFVVNQLHKRATKASTNHVNLETKELRDMAMAIDVVWNLTRDIIDYDIAQSIDPEDTL